MWSSFNQRCYVGHSIANAIDDAGVEQSPLVITSTHDIVSLRYGEEVLVSVMSLSHVADKGPANAVDHDRALIIESHSERPVYFGRPNYVAVYGLGYHRVPVEDNISIAKISSNSLVNLAWEFLRTLRRNDCSASIAGDHLGQSGLARIVGPFNYDIHGQNVPD